jgi:lysophospholipid acyltransferase (LPLAT)-like uncharacterized protein
MTDSADRKGAARIRVDNVRGLRALAVALYGAGVAYPVMALFSLLRSSVRFEHTGTPRPLTDAPPITVAWHEHLPAVFLVCFPARVPTVWMNHPAWVMKPVHVMLRRYGVSEIALGSSGNDGRAALHRIVDAVRSGAATFLNPDGPHGPAHVVKSGVLDLAIATGRPVTALSFRYARAARLPTWDRKWIPLPGGVVEVKWSEPIVVTEANREQARRTIGAALDGVFETDADAGAP